MATVAWIPPLSPGASAARLQSPYQPSEQHLIQASQDFTVRFTTISRSILDRYGEEMQVRKHNNYHFCILSHFGIGSNGDNKPSTAINHIMHVDDFKNDILSFWGENIHFIKDYRVSGGDENTGRIYIGLSAFCQDLGGSSADSLRSAFVEATTLIGRFAPWLAPYTSVGSRVITGVANIVHKAAEKRAECKEASLTLYPGTTGAPLPAGDAYLQLGSYIFFFEQIADDLLAALSLTASGQVIAGGNATVDVPPYVVINLVDGIADAPLDVFTNSAAADILEKYQARYDPGARSSNASMNLLAEGLGKIGESYYHTSRIKRYAELLAKPVRSDREAARLAEIKNDIQSVFPGLTL